MKAGSLLVCLGFAASAAGSMLMAAEPITNLQQVVEMWKNKEYLQVVQVLKEYRQGPYGKTPEVDYMIASSLCRLPGYEGKGKQYFQWLLYNHRLDDRSRSQVLEEMQNCASAQIPIVINFVVARSGAGARVGGKMFFPVSSPDLPVTSVPVTVVREIPTSEMAERLTPMSAPVRGIRTVKGLMGPGAVVEAHGHFLLAKKVDPGIAAPVGSLADRLRSPTVLAEFGNTLEQYLKFFTTEFKMRMPTNFIAVYALADSGSVRKMAESLHGIQVSELSIGYSYRDDLSLVGLLDGTLFHELFHLLVYNNFGDIPPWLDEGMAALYEVSEVRGGAVQGLPNWRGEVLQAFRSRRPPLDNLVRMDWRGLDDADGEYRSERQAVTHATARYFMLMLQERQQLARMYDAFRNRTVETVESDPAEEAVRLVEKVTGQSIAALDQDFEQWCDRMLGARAGGRPTQPSPPLNAAAPFPILNAKAKETANDVDPTRSSRVSEAEIRRSVTLHASRDEKVVDTFNGRPRRIYSIWIKAPPDIISEIAKVQYRYDPNKGFSPSIREQATPYNGFMDSYLGIGAVDADMDIDLVLHDDRRVTLKFNVYRAIFPK
jgi:hypothetical protein